MFKDAIVLGEDEEWNTELADQAREWFHQHEIPQVETQGISRRFIEVRHLDAEACAAHELTVGSARPEPTSRVERVDACRASPAILRIRDRHRSIGVCHEFVCP